ncbi:hypothetical protein [Saccharomonospora halophila]|uniref:hypothetical protein n=1 Tax=Saccharomonospora halophila TaxID=129922 RepID=UPI0012F795FF|nr:hypothetical protein [Saccharomonospora halophila]
MGTDQALSPVNLLYARRGPEQPEPLIAVVSTEDEARAIEAEVVGGEPETRVVWETHEVGGQVGDTVHIVLLAAGGDSGPEATDPIAVSVFATRRKAESDLTMRRTGDDGAHYSVRSLPLGWRRSGWPFVGNR